MSGWGRPGPRLGLGVWLLIAAYAATIVCAAVLLVEVLA